MSREECIVRLLKEEKTCRKIAKKCHVSLRDIDKIRARDNSE